jgi:hypothetical protein
MTVEKAYEIKMLEELMIKAGSGKRIDLHAKPVREIVQLERDGKYSETVILSIEYSGRVDDKAFKFKKSYSFADDAPQDALECLLIANSRLQVDLERLRKSGIQADAEFFNFRNCLMDLPDVVSMESPDMRLQGFINLARAGVPVSVDVTLERPPMVLTQEGVKKKGFGCIATFTFIKGSEKTTIEKLYDIGSYDDAQKEDPVDIVEVANRRLERDCERLRDAGMTVDKLSFLHIWERVYSR